MVDHKSKLTSEEYWSEYWHSKSDSLICEVPEKYLFSDIIEQYLPKGRGCSFLEIGGFPGYFSVFFKKYFGCQVTLLDYYIDKQIVADLCHKNNIPPDIALIEGDLFNNHHKEKFDVVMSAGFIEHFTDSEEVIRKHVEMLKVNGYLLIGLPNFKGLNGLLQHLMDRENMQGHNLACMDIGLLERIFKQQKIEVLHADYYGKFSLWLEKIERRSFITRSFIWLSNILGSFLVRKESKLFAPFIFLIGRKLE